MKRILFHAIGLALAISVAWGCGSKSSGESNGASVDGVAALKKSGPENFSEFLKRFREDSVFQKSRVDFPLPQDILENVDDDRYNTEKIKAEDWHYANFRYDPSFATRELDAYTERIVKEQNRIKMIYEGVDNGINIILEFELQNNQWMLVRWSDLST